MRLVTLLLLCLTLTADDLQAVHDKIPAKVLIIFNLTVVNKDKNTKETTTIQETFILKEWEKSYRPLTLLELKSYDQFGYIKALPVIVTVQTL